MTEEKKMRRPRGASPRGSFEIAKSVAVASETARIEAAKRKTESLKEARLKREQAAASVAVAEPKRVAFS